MNEQSTAVEGISSSNVGFENSSALQIRLETNGLLEQIEFFLRGLEPNTYWDDKTKTFQQKLVKMGNPKLNMIGIQAVLNKCRALINPQVVQGNYDINFYLLQIKDIRVEIAYLLFANYYRWEVKNKTDIKEVTETIMNTVESFLSRTIDNKERESYAQTIKTSESSTLASKGALGMFGGNK